MLPSWLSSIYFCQQKGHYYGMKQKIPLRPLANTVSFSAPRIPSACRSACACVHTWATSCGSRSLATCLPFSLMTKRSVPDSSLLILFGVSGFQWDWHLLWRRAFVGFRHELSPSWVTPPCPSLPSCDPSHHFSPRMTRRFWFRSDHCTQ